MAIFILVPILSISCFCMPFHSFSSVQLFSHVQLFVTPWTAALQASLSITNSQSLLKLMSIELVMPYNHLILCSSLLLPSIFPTIRVFFQWVSSSHQVAKVLELQLHISLPSEYSGLISLGLTGLISLQSTYTYNLYNYSCVFFFFAYFYSTLVTYCIRLNWLNYHSLWSNAC